MVHISKMEPGSHPWMWFQMHSCITVNLNFLDCVKLKNTSSLFWGCATKHPDRTCAPALEIPSLNH